MKLVGFLLVGLALICLSASVRAQPKKQKISATLASETVATQKVQSQYKGVHLGMTPQEVRAKLGDPAGKAQGLDYFVFSETETATIAYNSGNQVVTISVDYQNGVGAPDYRTVVGEELLTRDDGSLYRLVRRPSEGFWVSYGRTAPGTVVIVSITIQKL